MTKQSFLIEIKIKCDIITSIAPVCCSPTQLCYNYAPDCAERKDYSRHDVNTLPAPTFTKSLQTLQNLLKHQTNGFHFFVFRVLNVFQVVRGFGRASSICLSIFFWCPTKRTFRTNRNMFCLLLIQTNSTLKLPIDSAASQRSYGHLNFGFLELIRHTAETGFEPTTENVLDSQTHDKEKFQKIKRVVKT
jgi:hypothetical protein